MAEGARRREGLRFPARRSPPPAPLALPLSRVKLIMKSCPDVSSINQDALVLTAKATELFVQHLATYAYKSSTSEKKELAYNDLADCVENSETFQFLAGFSQGHRRRPSSPAERSTTVKDALWSTRKHVGHPTQRDVHQGRLPPGPFQTSRVEGALMFGASNAKSLWRRTTVPSPSATGIEGQRPVGTSLWTLRMDITPMGRISDKCALFKERCEHYRV